MGKTRRQRPFVRPQTPQHELALLELPAFPSVIVTAVR
jgi:hypothetical protein